MDNSSNKKEKIKMETKKEEIKPYNNPLKTYQEKIVRNEKDKRLIP